MDEYVLKSYFFKVGRSYYNSSDFDRLFRTASATKPPLASRFGIGFLACFMLADLVEIETFPTPPHGSCISGLRVSIERLGALAYVQEISGKCYGTTIKLRLRSSLGSIEIIHAKIFDFLKATVVRPAGAVSISLPNRMLNIQSNDYYSLVDKPRPPEVVPNEKFHVINLDIKKYSSIFLGRVIFAFVSNDEETLLDVRYNDRLLTLDANPIKGRISIPPYFIFRQFTGNRITVGGFRMQLPGLGKLLRHRATILPVVFDIDILPGPHVEFDVARTRIIDGSMSLRIQLKEAIRLGLEDIGVWSKLTDSVKKALELRTENDPFRVKQEILRNRNQLETDEELLLRVLNILPKDNWPISLHREVAHKLDIPNRKAFQAISTLIVEGRVKNPNLDQKVN